MEIKRIFLRQENENFFLIVNPIQEKGTIVNPIQEKGTIVNQACNVFIRVS